MFGRILESNLLLNAMSGCYVSMLKNKQWGLCWIFCLFLDFFSLEFLQVHWTYETFESSMGEKPIKTLRKVRVRTETSLFKGAVSERNSFMFFLLHISGISIRPSITMRTGIHTNATSSKAMEGVKESIHQLYSTWPRTGKCIVISC